MAGRVLFSASIAVNAAALSFIAVALVATFGFPDDLESAEGWGLVWFFSLPVILFLSALSSAAFRTYKDARTTLARALFYFGLVIAVAFLAPLPLLTLSWARM